jgi:hypothetical protein
MGLLNDDPPLNADREESLASETLGEPDAIFRAGGRRSLFKMVLGISLILFGIVANYYWWFLGPARLGHIAFHVLFVPPIIGGTLLWFLYRNRGLRVLLYPTGLLRLRTGEAESIPWDNVQAIRLQLEGSKTVFVDDETDQLLECWLITDVPQIQVWKTWLEIEHSQGNPLRLTPAVEDYTNLTERIQRVVFAKFWPTYLATISRGESIAFGDMLVSEGGLLQGGKFLAWHELQEIKLQHQKMTIKKSGAWRTWLTKAISEIPNFHLLVGLIAALGDYRIGAAVEKKSKPPQRIERPED